MLASQCLERGVLLLPPSGNCALKLNFRFLGLPFCSDPKLPVLIKLMVWAQKQLSEKANFPRMVNAVEATFEYSEDVVEPAL